MQSHNKGYEHQVEHQEKLNNISISMTSKFYEIKGMNIKLTGSPVNL